ncbi:putative zinc transporter msc2, partial [Nowakowskiella sp. JEL0078]
MRSTWKKTPYKKLAVTALFAAIKACDIHVRIKDILRAWYLSDWKFFNPEGTGPQTLNETSEVRKLKQCKTMRDDIIRQEDWLGYMLCFDFEVETAHKPFIKLMKEFKASDHCIATGMKLLNDSYRTTLCLRYPHEIIATTVAYMAIKLAADDTFVPPEDNVWEKYAEFLPEIAKIITSQYWTHIPIHKDKPLNQQQICSPPNTSPYSILTPGISSPSPQQKSPIGASGTLPTPETSYPASDKKRKRLMLTKNDARERVMKTKEVDSTLSSNTDESGLGLRITHEGTKRIVCARTLMQNGTYSNRESVNNARPSPRSSYASLPQDQLQFSSNNSIVSHHSHNHSHDHGHDHQQDHGLHKSTSLYLSHPDSLNAQTVQSSRHGSFNFVPPPANQPLEAAANSLYTNQNFRHIDSYPRNSVSSGKSFSSKSHSSGFLSISYLYIRSIINNPATSKIFYFCVLNLSFTVVEGLWGYWTNSLGLISDAVHMLFDSSAIAVSLVASVIAKWEPNGKFTYGFGRVETLTGFVNAILLGFTSLQILWEAFERMWNPPALETDQLLVVSILGLV